MRVHITYMPNGTRPEECGQQSQRDAYYDDRAVRSSLVYVQCSHSSRHVPTWTA